MKKSSIVIIAGTVLVIGVALFFVLNTNKLATDQTSITQPTNPVSKSEKLQVGSNICTEFSKEWVAKITDKTIVKTDSIGDSATNVCQYYTDENNFLTLRLNNLSVENQKKGQQALGRSITTNDKIKMEHFIAVQSNGLINGIYLVINPNQFLAIDRSSSKALSENEIVNLATNVADAIQNGTNSEHAIVPLPRGEDIVRSFFNIIGENRPSDAVGMMSQKQTGDESIKQAWGVQFNAFKTVQVVNIEPSMQTDWTNNYQSYKVLLNVQMKSEAANALIPYFGWENGTNVRFINLIKNNEGIWKVDGIATGP
jgi:hypothetical protein